MHAWIRVHFWNGTTKLQNVLYSGFMIFKSLACPIFVEELQLTCILIALQSFTVFQNQL